MAASTAIPSSFPRVWMITGASRGIGARIAEAALAQGDAVVATSRNADAITQRLGTRDALLPMALDVTDEAQARHAVGAALERFGRIDVLVNNAGYGLLGAVEESTADEVRRLYETNVFGLLHVTRAVLPTMRARCVGHVINISSLGGVQSSAGFGLYCSTPSLRSRASPRRCTPSWRHWASTPRWWNPGTFGPSSSIRPRWWFHPGCSAITRPAPARCARRPAASTGTSPATPCAWPRP